MRTYDSDQIATELARWLRKPFLNWYFLANLTIAILAVIAALVTQIWWLLFIPVVALAECAGLYISSIFAEVLRDRDAEIERLRRELGAV